MDRRFISRPKHINSKLKETIDSLGFISSVCHSYPHPVEFMVFVHFVDIGQIYSELTDEIVRTDEVMVHQTDFYHGSFKIVYPHVIELKEQQVIEDGI